jgi:uncharacterized membrane protein YphA (DoxX/SURF4 family)
MTFSRNDKGLRVLVLFLRLALGSVFVYAAWTKLRDPWALFALSIDSYQLLPQWAVEVVARTLPWLELLIGLLLMAGLRLRLASAITSLLLVLFLGLAVRARLKGMQIDCGCFGPGEALSWKTLLRDGTLLGSSLVLNAVSFAPRLSTTA